MIISLCSKKRLISFACLAVGIATASVAQADGWPTSVAGTWTIVANQTHSTLLLTQGTAGAGAQCLPIEGSAFADSVHGFYCPGSGRISFRRGTSDQTYIGNLSQAGTPNRMAGTWESLGGDFGEYNFYAISNPASN